jgi:4-hydroxy-tetrahydrodipicolinate synthase
MFKKSIVALITPFRQDRVDEGALERLVAWHHDQGTHALVVCGCTGEGASLTHAEHLQVVTRAVAASQGRIPIIASTGSFTTRETVFLSQQSQRAGAQGLMVITPPYLKPSQEGIYQHFQAVHEATDLPIMMYHNPGRTCGVLSDETLQRLAGFERIAALKDSTDNLSWPMELRRLLGERFTLLSGEDPTFVGFMAQGGHGTVSITANLMPGAYAQFHHAWKNKDMETVSRLRDFLFPLSKAMICVSNPIPVKYAASLMGLCEMEVRLPLVPPAKAQRDLILKALTDVNLLEVAKNAHA